MKGSHFSIRKRVEFADTDVAGIMHFSNFFRFMEVCEHAFIRSLGFSVHPPGIGNQGLDSAAEVGWPRVHVSCDYRKALKFEEEVEIELVVVGVKKRTIDYRFSFWKDPQGNGDSERVLAATGSFTVLCVAWDKESGEMKAAEIPAEMRGKLEQIQSK
jgi:YbgC/YbaW family acyl-CoA thioester hydrolase